MRLTTAKQIIMSRDNAVGFLQATHILKIEKLLCVDNLPTSYNDIITIVLDKYENKQISNKVMSECVEILTSQNPLLKTERYRFVSASNDIYEYWPTYNAYLFLQKGNKNDYKKLINQNGEYL